MLAYPHLVARDDMDAETYADVLADAPSATMFAFDDGNVVAWFSNPIRAAEWLASMVLDSVERRGLDDFAADWARDYRRAMLVR